MTVDENGLDNGDPEGAEGAGLRPGHEKVFAEEVFIACYGLCAILHSLTFHMYRIRQGEAFFAQGLLLSAFSPSMPPP